MATIATMNMSVKIENEGRFIHTPVMSALAGTSSSLGSDIVFNLFFLAVRGRDERARTTGSLP